MLDSTQTFLLAAERLRLSVERMFITRCVNPRDLPFFARFYDEFSRAFDDVVARRAKTPLPSNDQDALQLALIALIASFESVIIGLKVGFVRCENLNQEQIQAAMDGFERSIDAFKRMAALFGKN